MVMGGVPWRDGSWEVIRPMITIQFKMENACIFCNVIEIFYEKKNQDKKMKPYGPFKF